MKSYGVIITEIIEEEPSGSRWHPFRPAREEKEIFKYLTSDLDLKKVLQAIIDGKKTGQRGNP